MYCYNINLQRDFSPEDTVDLNLPTLHIIKNQAIDLTHFKATARYFNNQGRTVVIAKDLSDTVVAFIVEEIITLFWKKHNSTIFYVLHKKADLNLVNYWLIHIALPVYFSFQKLYFFLHVGSVILHNKAIAFMAECAGGKSTLTDFFMSKGHTLLTDDKLGVFVKENIAYGVPSHPHHRPYRAIETLGEKVDNFAKEPYKLESIYLLHQAESEAIIAIEEIKGIEKFTQLRHGSELNYNLEIAKETSILGTISNTIPMYRISIPWDLKRLPEVYGAIVQHNKGSIE